MTTQNNLEQELDIRRKGKEKAENILFVMEVLILFLIVAIVIVFLVEIYLYFYPTERIEVVNSSRGIFK